MATKPKTSTTNALPAFPLDLAIACLYDRLALDRQAASHMQDQGRWDSEKFHNDRANQCAHAISILQKSA